MNKKLDSCADTNVCHMLADGQWGDACRYVQRCLDCSYEDAIFVCDEVYERINGEPQSAKILIERWYARAAADLRNITDEREKANKHANQSD